MTITVDWLLNRKHLGEGGASENALPPRPRSATSCNDTSVDVLAKRRNNTRLLFGVLAFLLTCWILASDHSPDLVRTLKPLAANAGQAEIAEHFFLCLCQKKAVDLPPTIELSDAMSKWYATNNARKTVAATVQKHGGLGECRQKEIVKGPGNTSVVELCYSGVKQSFMVRVSFDGTKIVGIHFWPWTDEQSQIGVPIQLETKTGTLCGSLLIPVRQVFEPVPIVLIIAGSGPTDRNGNQPLSLMTNAYRMLAEELQDNDIASLRYDKRGIGASAAAGPDEINLRFEDYVDDAAAWIDMLASEKEYSKIIVLGHSEGALVGMLACQKSGNANGFISLCGSGRTVDALILEQLGRQLKFQDDTAQKKILESLKCGETVDDVPKELLTLFRPSVQPYMISWMKYDPAVEIEKLTIPTLIIQGTKDIQISLEDAEILAKAKPDANKTIIDGMNHVLKNSTTTFSLFQLSDYANPDSPLNEKLTPAIVKFISGVN